VDRKKTTPKQQRSAMVIMAVKPVVRRLQCMRKQPERKHVWETLDKSVKAISKVKEKGFTYFMYQSWHWILGALCSIGLTIMSILIKLGKCSCCCFKSRIEQQKRKAFVGPKEVIDNSLSDYVNDGPTSTSGHTTFVFNGPVSWSCSCKTAAKLSSVETTV
jgi:hypothetical protein